MNFPTSAEAFSAFQEEHIGRKLTAFERELCEPLVELINIYHDFGKEGRCMDDLLEDIAQFYIKEGHAEDLQNPSVQRIHRLIDLCAERHMKLERSNGKMDKKKRSERKERERERKAQIGALRWIRDDTEATPGERLEAIKLLLELENIW